MVAVSGLHCYQCLSGDCVTDGSLGVSEKCPDEVQNPTCYTVFLGKISILKVDRSPWVVQGKQVIKICWHLICSPIHPRLLGRDGFKPSLRPGYFLLQSPDCMMETCMLLMGWGSMTPVKAIRVGVGITYLGSYWVKQLYPMTILY